MCRTEWWTTLSWLFTAQIQAILPSDFASRNVQDCNNLSCQMCNSIHFQEELVVRHITTQDVLSGKVKHSFTVVWTRWMPNIQRALAQSSLQRYASLQEAYQHKICKEIPLQRNTCSERFIGCQTLPFITLQECIIVPRQILGGSFTSFQIKLDHPSCHQGKSVINCYFYAFDLEKSVETVTNTFH